MAQRTQSQARKARQSFWRSAGSLRFICVCIDHNDYRLQGKNRLQEQKGAFFGPHAPALCEQEKTSTSPLLRRQPVQPDGNRIVAPGGEREAQTCDMMEVGVAGILALPTLTARQRNLEQHPRMPTLITN